MKKIISILLMALLATQLAAMTFYKIGQADGVYAERRATPLNTAEKQAVGKWQAKNREVEWEIDRKQDGTYVLAMIEVVDGYTYRFIDKGVWYIKGDDYSYIALETSDPDIELDGTPTTEKVLKSTDTYFLTVMPGQDGETLDSNERRVKRFRMKTWDEYNSTKD